MSPQNSVHLYVFLVIKTCILVYFSISDKIVYIDRDHLCTMCSAFSHRSDIPVLWLRVDPYFAWIRQVSTEQPDTTWCMMLKHERDSNAQIMVSHCVYELVCGTRLCYLETIP